MIRPNVCIYLIPLHPAFNKNKVKIFNELDLDHSSQLYSSLYLNYYENFQETTGRFSLKYCIDETDSKYLPDELSDQKDHLILFNTKDNITNLKTLTEKYFPAFNINIIVLSHSIGNSVKEFCKVIDLLYIDTDTVALGKTKTGKVAYFGFNYLNTQLMGEIDLEDLNYDNFLYKVNKHDNFLYVLNNSMLIENERDFKNLYTELSKKESWEYCNQKMHEKFTNLFIEYKELLK